MSNINPFFSWKCHVISVMREKGLPIRLTATEVERMENFWYWGYSAEEFVETLTLVKQAG